MNKQLKKTFFLAIVLIFAVGCSKNKAALNYNFYVHSESSPQDAPAQYPDVSFAVISDIHIYDSALGSSGAAFDNAMNSDRKLLLDGVDLLDYAIENIIASGTNFVFVSGDLTKDGELVCHQIVAEKLKRLTGAGLPVYVVPGNHDVNNPDAVKYSGDNKESVASVSASDFAQIYGGFGFDAAFMRDAGSLSYVAELTDGLWLLALDACRYRENKPGVEEIVSGKISQQTADWAASVLRSAKSANKAVISMIHHGVVEHWDGQSKLHPDYLINDYLNFGRFLASWDVRLVFTGHYHAQDVSRADFAGKFIYDVETGSLVTAPSPVRYVEIRDNTVNIRTETIVEKLRPGTDFASNAAAFVKKTVMIEAAGVLKDYKVSDKDTDYISNAVGDAFNAHYSGDENPALRQSFDKSKLGLWGRFVYGQQRYVIDGLWKDLSPADNNVSFRLSN